MLILYKRTNSKYEKCSKKTKYHKRDSYMLKYVDEYCEVGEASCRW